MSQTRERIALPGFGLPLDTLPDWSLRDNKKRFPHAIADFFASDGVTLRERRMLEFITQISDKPEWDRKVFDETIVSKWKTEACRYDAASQDDYLSEHMFNYCIQELREKAQFHQLKGLVAVMDAEATVVKSDVLVSESLRQALIQGARPLEQVSDRLKDWHPGSDEVVLDLVHPSLFPVVYGRSRALPFGLVPLEDCAKYTGRGEVIPEHKLTDSTFKRVISWENETNLRPWGNYQWLPTQIDFTHEGLPKIASYINNLHPQMHADLYEVLEQFVDKAIPVWNECLSWFHDRIRIKPDVFNDENWSYPALWEARVNHEDSQLDLGDDESEVDEDEEWAWKHNLYDEWDSWKLANRVLKQIEPDAFKPFRETLDQPGACSVDLKTKFKGSGLQVIFKLANIHLTPDKPEYNASNWHVEGALNEHICATALYYYDSDNISPSHLAFRQSIDVQAMIEKPEQHQWSSACAYYGIENEEAGIQELGRVATPQGRLIAFPNVLQHQVQPFRLADPTRPGHRKILAMFLVDPHFKVLSTANVPPQRRDWWAREVRKVPPFTELPEEIFQQIVEGVEWFPLGWEEACEMREALMEERGRMTEEIDDMMNEDTFYFCEH